MKWRTVVPFSQAGPEGPAYNALNQIVWDNPDLTITSSNFGKVTRKRVDGSGREIQIGLRFIF